MDVICADTCKGPQRVENMAEQSLDFLVEEALKSAGSPPDIIYDTGDVGKEPALRLFARDPSELLKKMEMMQSWKTN